MAGRANVKDIDVFRRFRAAMIKFHEAAEQALSGADSDVSSTMSWLETEQASFWQNQLHKRMEMVTKARDAVRQKKMYRDSTGRAQDSSQEEKHLKRCEAAVEQAHEKIDAVKKWRTRLEKASDMYRGGVSRLSRSLSDMPGAVAQLDRLAMALEAYVNIEGPAPMVAEGTVDGESGMARGGEEAVEEKPEAAHPKKEGDDGAVGL